MDKRKRRKGRLLAIQSLYPARIGVGEINENFSNLVKAGDYSDKALSFATRLVKEVKDHSEEVDGLIKSVLENWEWNRLCTMDKSILGVAVTELLYFPENPPRVVINEAIEIAKEYSTEKSGAFVNGILDRIAKEKGIL